MASQTRTLYVGVTNDLQKRVYQHKTGAVEGFTHHYKLTSLVYFEESTDVKAAIEREKQLKGWLRSRKVSLIESTNPHWNDLGPAPLHS